MPVPSAGPSTAARVPPALLGIRHHGPGSARAVRRALDAFRPEVVLIEGPPEADTLVPWVGAETMAPPVALLAYTLAPASTAPAPTARGGRRSAAYWPF